jgi:hypothetical protein
MKKVKEYPEEVLKVIPKGYYCHGKLVSDGKGRFKESTPGCPFWFMIKDREKQENGYCVLLGKGDYEINREPHIGEWSQCDKGKVIKKWKEHYGPNNPDSSSLLWDECKECGIKLEE